MVPGGAVGKDAALVIGAPGGHDVGAGHQLGRAELNRGVLGEVEDLDEVELGAEDVVGVVMPVLRGHGAFGKVLTGEDGEADVAAEQRAHDADDLRIEQDVLNEPVLKKDGAGRNGEADALDVGFGHAVGHVAGVGRDLAFEIVAGAAVDLVGDGAAQQQMAFAAEFEHLRVGQGRFAVEGVNWLCRGSLRFSDCVAVLVMFAPVGLVAAVAAEAVGGADLVGGWSTARPGRR